jgi:hypothetical protein
MWQIGLNADDHAEEGGSMANEEHLAQLKRGNDAWNQWRGAHTEILPDLSGADLGGARLPKVDLRGANLAGANLYWADLRKADLRGAALDGAHLPEAHLAGANLAAVDLSGVDLRKADLSRAALAGANLAEADLRAAELHGADLRGAILTAARIQGTTFGDVDLSVVQGLDTVTHEGPSTIGIDTLYRSHGNIPEVFLRGAGVHDDMITYSKSLVGRPFEFYSCFISYSSKDQDFAERLHADLQDKGVRCWFAPHDIQGGRKIDEQIDQAIRLHERLLLILSVHSMQSEWVKTASGLIRGCA